MNEVKFAYKPKTGLSILIIIILTLTTLIFSQIALNNDAGLGYRSVEWSVDSATIFYWIITGLFFIFTIAWIKGYIKGRSTGREIVLGTTSLSAPKNGLSSKIKVIAYKDILSTSTGQLNGHTMLNIKHSNGTFMIPQAMLVNKDAFSELVELIEKKRS